MTTPMKHAIDPTAAAPITLERVITELRTLGTSDRLLGLYELGLEGCANHDARQVTLVVQELITSLDYEYADIADGFRRVASRSAALGFDGKWVLHPDQVGIANEVYSPSQEDYDHAELILDAYDYYTSEAGGAKGSAMLGDEMIDEASRKMALVIAAKGRAAGMARTATFTPPDQG